MTWSATSSRGARTVYPFRARVLTVNPYGFAIGHEFEFARRKEGGGSPYPVQVTTPEGRTFQFREAEVALLPVEP